VREGEIYPESARDSGYIEYSGLRQFPDNEDIDVKE